MSRPAITLEGDQVVVDNLHGFDISSILGHSADGAKKSAQQISTLAALQPDNQILTQYALLKQKSAMDAGESERKTARNAGQAAGAVAGVVGTALGGWLGMPALGSAIGGIGSIFGSGEAQQPAQQTVPENKIPENQPAIEVDTKTGETVISAPATHSTVSTQSDISNSNLLLLGGAGLAAYMLFFRK